MIYTEYNKLTKINLMNEAGSISFDELGEILKERPANVVYCELSGEIYGIISMGMFHVPVMMVRRQCA